MIPMHTPHARPTNLDALKRRYIRGDITLDRLEQEMGILVDMGTEHHPAPPLHLVGTRPPSSHHDGSTAA